MNDTPVHSRVKEAARLIGVSTDEIYRIMDAMEKNGGDKKNVTLEAIIKVGTRK